MNLSVDAAGLQMPELPPSTYRFIFDECGKHNSVCVVCCTSDYSYRISQISFHLTWSISLQKISSVDSEPFTNRQQTITCGQLF